MNLTIQKAAPEDAADLLDYLRKAGAETGNLTFGEEGIPFTVEQEAAYIASVRNSSNSVMLVARLDGKLVGNASFNSTPRERLKHRGELGISVLKEAWGMGIGTKLMEAVIDFAKNTANADIIHLEVRSDNTRAIRLYERFGFEKIGTFHGFLKINGELIDFDLMNLYFP